MSRTKSAEDVLHRWRLEAWFCHMVFAEDLIPYTPDWPAVLDSMPFWARQLLAVMISMEAIQQLMDDDNGAYGKQLVIQQLNMWYV